VAEDPLHRAARVAHRVPGYRWVRRRAVPRIRRSAVARALAGRIFLLESTTSETPVDVAPGRLLAGLGVERLPVILLSFVGIADNLGEKATVDDVVDSAIEDVAEMQLLGAGFRPVFLLDTPAFTRARSYDYVVELVTPRAAWPGEVADWSDYVHARVASMRSTYGITGVITVGTDGLDEVARGVLRSFG
jgi:hypothetical protein